MTRHTISSEPRIAHLEAIEQGLVEVLNAYTPVAFDYSCTVPGIELSGFSIAQNGSRGGDLAFPVMFLAPEERDSRAYSLYPNDVQSHAIVHPLKKGPSRLGLFMADPTGHRLVDGVLASMLYQSARVAVHYELRARDDVGSSLAQTLNDSFYRGVSSPLPIALLLARFQPDASRGGVTGSYISGGNPHPRILRKDSEQFDFFDVSKVHCSASIGLLPTILEGDENAYKPNRFHLNKGDIMVLYSDGLTDLGKTTGNSYFPRDNVSERSRFLETLLQVRNKSAQDIARGVHEDIITFSLVHEDDTTVYVVKAV